LRKFIAIAAVLALAACNNAGPEAEDVEATTTSEVADNSDVLEGEAPGFEAVAPGTYQVTRAGGEVDYVEIHPGMTFSRIAADGAATGGSIFMKDGKTCFIVEGVEQENCFTDGPRQPDGTMQTTSAEGNLATVRSVEGSLSDHAKTATE
jgi:predicted small lipoprotein YifL